MDTRDLVQKKCVISGWEPQLNLSVFMRKMDRRSFIAESARAAAGTFLGGLLPYLFYTKPANAQGRGGFKYNIDIEREWNPIFLYERAGFKAKYARTGQLDLGKALDGECLLKREYFEPFTDEIVKRMFAEDAKVKHTERNGEDVDIISFDMKDTITGSIFTHFWMMKVTAT